MTKFCTSRLSYKLLYLSFKNGKWKKKRFLQISCQIVFRICKIYAQDEASVYPWSGINHNLLLSSPSLTFTARTCIWGYLTDWPKQPSIMKSFYVGVFENSLIFKKKFFIEILAVNCDRQLLTSFKTGVPWSTWT